MRVSGSAKQIACIFAKTTSTFATTFVLPLTEDLGQHLSARTGDRYAVSLLAERNRCSIALLFWSELLLPFHERFAVRKLSMMSVMRATEEADILDRRP